MNHYQKHIGDWRTATGKLTRVQRDIYAELIDTYYDQEAPLVGDFLRLCEDQGCRTDEEREALTYILSRYFKLEDGVYRHDRCDDEIAHFHHKVEQASAAGKQSASVRAQRKMGAVGGKPTRPTTVKRTSNEPSTEGQLPITHYPPSSPDGEQVVSAKPKATKKAPPEFLVTKEMAAWAVGQKVQGQGLEWTELVDSSGQPAQLTLQEVKQQTQAMRDHTFPRGITDWVGAWRNWMRNYATRRRPQGRLTPSQSARDARDAERNRVIETLTGRNPNGTGRQSLVIDGESRVVGEGEGLPPDEDR